MIAKGTHHVTGQPQTEVTCDHPGCDQAMYIQDGPVTAANRANDLGWQTTKHTHPQGLDEYNALCPVHATTQPQPCTHDTKHQRLIDNQTRCGKCGQPRQPAPTHPGILPAAALALLARQIPGTGEVA